MEMAVFTVVKMFLTQGKGRAVEEDKMQGAEANAEAWGEAWKRKCPAVFWTLITEIERPLSNYEGVTQKRRQ